MKYGINSFVITGLALMALSCAQNSSTGNADVKMPQLVNNVEVATAVIKEVPQDETYTTTVQAYVTNNVVPQSGSRIKKINVEIGDFVRVGQVLAEMDQANLQQTRLKLANDSTELGRLKELYAQGGISKSDFEQVQLAYNVSKTQYENLVENTILRSPVNGVITARNYDAGDMYAMSSPIFTVQQITPVKLLVAISETDYTKVKKGDSVQVTADALPGRTFTGKVDRIYPTIDPATHTFTVEVVVQNSDRALRPGMFARAHVTFAVNKSIVIPDSGIMKLQGSGQKSVFVLNSDNTVSSRVVTVGRHYEGQYEILSGLSEGEQVVVKGFSSLKSGSEVNVISK